MRERSLSKRLQNSNEAFSYDWQFSWNFLPLGEIDKQIFHVSITRVFETPTIEIVLK